MKPSTILLALVVAVSMTVGAWAQAPAGGAEAPGDLPIRRVTAFSSGVSYFEHAGKITGDAKVLLKFKTGQINDILKSLVAMDLGGGNVTGVSYASRDPITRALKSFGVDISGKPSLGELLRQVRGTEVVVSAPREITGKVLGVETKTRHILPSNTIVRQEVLNLVTPGGIRSIPLDTVSAIKLADEKLNAELNKALALLVESRDTNRKPVTVEFAGRGAREVRIGYVAEAPIWKTSYRLVLGDDDIRLQGWAIVENTSDFDWSKVELTLVSGRPISFVQDLYTPLYLPRPEVRPELYASLRPQVYEEGIEAEEKVLALRAKAKSDRARRPAGPARAEAAKKARAYLGRAEAGKASQAVRDALRRGAAPVAAGKGVGELFSYRIKTPVTIQRRKSAMLPIVNQAVKARKISIYNASVLAAHPLNGVWLTNDTGLSLLAGPVTVFDAGTYAGDARIDNLSPEDRRLLSYAIDLKVKVDSSDESTSRITSVRIVRGVLRLKRKHVYTRAYVIMNKADKKRTILIEHPRRSGLMLVTPAEPKKTPGVYRFEVDVPGGTIGKFPVVEERTDSQTVAILPSSIRALQWYTTSREIPAAVRKAIAEAVARKKALTAAEREVSNIQRRISTLIGDQRRARANVEAFKSQPGGATYKRFAKKLMTIEDEIERLQGELRAARKKVEDLRKKLEDHLDGLDID